MSGRAEEIAVIQQKDETKHLLDGERLGRKHKHALMFARAAHAAKLEHLDGDLTSEQRRRRDLEMQMQLDADQLRAQLRVTNEQLSETRRKLAELQALLGQPISSDGVYEAFMKLETVEQLHVERRIVMSDTPPPLLPPLEHESRYEVMAHLLVPLNETECRSLIERLAAALLPTQLAKLAESCLREHLTSTSRTPDDAGRAIAEVLRLHLPLGESAAVLAEQSERREELVAGIHAALGETRNQIEVNAPEYWSAIMQLMPKQLVPPKGTDDSDFWAAQIKERDSKIESLNAHLAQLLNELKSLRAQYKAAQGEVNRLRKNLASALSATDHPDLSVAEPQEDGGPPSPMLESPPREDGQNHGEKVKYKLTVTLMRSYREELYHAQARIAELEALLKQQEDRFNNELNALRETIAARDAALAKAQADMHRMKRDLANARSKRPQPNVARSIANEIDDSIEHEDGEQTAGGVGVNDNRASRHMETPRSQRAGKETDALPTPRRGGKDGGKETDPNHRRRQRGASSNASRSNSPRAVALLVKKERPSIPLGSVCLDTSGSKAMSITFLFRLISNLTSAKLVADQKQALAGRVPTSFPEFVCYQMISFYGSKSIATRYLQEMYVGLDRKRKQHSRIMLFARALQVFPESVLATEACVMLVRYLSTLLFIMESEKVQTKTSSVNFFQAYGSMCTCYVPVEYMLRAIAEVHPDGDSEAAAVKEFAREHVLSHSLPDEPACVQAAHTNESTRRATILGAGGVAPETPPIFIDCDKWLADLATFYEDAITDRQRAREDAFAKYDLDGDGRISLDEFHEMLPDLYDLKANPMSAQEQEMLYDNLIALGGGQIRQADLDKLLFVARSKSNAKRQASCRQLELADPQQEAEEKEKLAEIVAMWDSVRMSTDDAAPDRDRLDWFERNDLHVLRIQRIWRTRLREVRRRGSMRFRGRGGAVTIGNALFGSQLASTRASSAIDGDTGTETAESTPRY